MLLALNPAALAPGPLIVTMGLISLVFAAFMLYRRRDIKRMFAYSSIEHMGIITFAFGMGGPLANFAGLLHMTMHSLTKSAIFFAVGHIAQVKGTQRIADMGGLTETNPVLGWGLVLGVVAIAGLPPLGIFMSEFLVVTSTFARVPWLAIVLVLGILIGVAGLFLRLNTIAFGGAPPRRPKPPMSQCLRISRSYSWPASTCRRCWSLGFRTWRSSWDNRWPRCSTRSKAGKNPETSSVLAAGGGRRRLALRRKSAVRRTLDAAGPVG